MRAIPNCCAWRKSRSYSYAMSSTLSFRAPALCRMSLTANVNICAREKRRFTRRSSVRATHGGAGAQKMRGSRGGGLVGGERFRLVRDRSVVLDRPALSAGLRDHSCHEVFPQLAGYLLFPDIESRSLDTKLWLLTCLGMVV